MPFWQLYYHIVWSTKNRQPLLTADVEPAIYALLRNKAVDLDASVYALNGYLDHVHLVASIPPKISVSKFVGQVKAVASVRFNQSGHPSAPFYWQEEYGAFSFDRKRLPYFITYVERQKEHHTNHQLIPALEKDSLDPVSSVRDDASIYGIMDETWVQEMLSYDYQPEDKSWG
jgi:REP element-mobilizing transposase RayT